MYWYNHHWLPWMEAGLQQRPVCHGCRVDMQRGVPAMDIRDYGPQPLAVNLKAAVKRNHTFRTALWTGSRLQLTVMSLLPGEDIGLEMHPDVDQFIYVEQGSGIVEMGSGIQALTYIRPVCSGSAVFIPAGTYHNLRNAGMVPLKLFSIYSPPEHPSGTVHASKSDAEEAGY